MRLKEIYSNADTILLFTYKAASKRAFMQVNYCIVQRLHASQLLCACCWQPCYIASQLKPPAHLFLEADVSAHVSMV